MPLYPALLGPSNQSESWRADCERTVNLFYGPQDVPGGRPTLYTIPGQAPFVTVTGDSDVRALASLSGRTFAVVGTILAEVFSSGTFVNRGTVIKNSEPAGLVFNGRVGNQLLVASGTNAYVLNLATNVLSAPVLTGEAHQIGFLDGYGLALNRTTGRLRLSNLNDFATWDPTQFAVRSAQPDPWTALIVNGPDLWLIGEHSGDIWFDAGTSPFPFAPRPGATFKFGIVAPNSLVVLRETVFWLARSEHGQVTVVQARGYTPQPVVSLAVSQAFGTYERQHQISDAEAFGVVYREHPFYVLTFPTANATWVYDVSTGLWSEWGRWNSPQNRFDQFVARVHTQAFDQCLLGLRNSSVIAIWEPTIATEVDGSELRRVRIPPAMQPGERQRLTIDRLELGMDAGLGTLTGQGVRPVVMLRFSHDFGRTWGSERQASVGAQGQYEQRVYMPRCGSSLVSWTPELTMSDPVPWRVTGAQIWGSGFGAGF